MLRRRILASAMASVMAIGSVAVVASAEDTAAATTQVKTKADLEAYVKSFDSFRSKEINDYASKSGENFLDALEYADNVINDTASTVDDYTVAYQMVSATYNKLKVYTAEELTALIKTNKAKYDTNNIYNEDLGDAIYKNEDNKNQWDNFVNAYEEANDVLNSKDSRIISDAYEALESAASNLALLDTVTKSQFRTALKTYEQLKQKVYDYDTWRRGTLPGWMDMKTGNYWFYSDGTNITIGALYSYLLTGEKNSDKTGWYDAYNDLDSNKSISKTSLSSIVDSYKMLTEANDLLSNWTADDTNRSSKASVKSLINDYRGVLVHDYNNAKVLDLYASVLATDTTVEVSQDSGYLDSALVLDPWERTVTTYKQKDYTADGYGVNSTLGTIDTEVTKMTAASITIRPTSGNIYIPLNDEGYWNGEAVSTSKPTGKYKLVSKKSSVDLTSFIDVTGMVVEATTSTQAAEAASKTTSGDEVRAAVADTDAATKALATSVASTNKAITEKYSNAKQKAAAKTYTDGLDRAFKAYNTAVTKYSSALKAGKSASAVNAAYVAILDAAAGLDTYFVNGDGTALQKFYKTVAGVEGFTTSDGNSPTDWWNCTNIYWVGEADYQALKTALGDLQTAAGALYDDLNAAEVAAYSDDSVVNNLKNDYIDAVGELGLAQSWYYGASIVNRTVTDVVPNLTKTLDNVQVDLSEAMAIAELYLEGDKDAIKDDSNPLYALNTTDEIAAGTAKASTAEWTIVYRYLKYALADKYDLPEAKYTKADVVDLLEKSYDLAEKTGDAGLFTVTHTALVAARKTASDWVASANKDKKYKDGNAVDGLTATQVYEDILWNAYNRLNKDYEAFKYSFGEVYTTLASCAEMLDEGDLTATDTLKSAMEETAYRLSSVGSMADDVDIDIENDAFDGERKFYDFNRVYSRGTGDDWTLLGTTQKAPKPEDNATMMSHYNLRVAYEALLAEIAKQTEVKTLLGDVNGDGVVNALDASAILKAVVNNTVIDVAVGDYNADGAVNALDASAILKYVVSQA